MTSIRPTAAPQTEAPRAGEDVCRVIVLGSTGSIGTQTLDVIEHLGRLHAAGRCRRRFEVVGLAAGRNVELLGAQAARFGVRALAVGNGAEGAPPGALTGPDACETLVRETPADLVVGAVVGAAGLPAVMAAVETGTDIALANKETLVAAGELVVPEARRTGARLLPLDSEHSAIWQCLRTGADGATPYAPPSLEPELEHVRRLILTASGGPFRERTPREVYHATPEEALSHPTWSMGAKVTVDSATLTNKALEVIEAHWLFGLPCERIDVLVHPQSIVHSLVEFADGSVIAQLGAPDMRTPIQHALAFPDRPDASADRLDLAALRRLDFEPPDTDRFPALRIAYDVIRAGGTAGAIFNGANEAAVEAFLDPGRSIPFGRIGELVAGAMRDVPRAPLRTLRDATEADAAARAHVLEQLAR